MMISLSSNLILDDRVTEDPVGYRSAPRAATPKRVQRLNPLPERTELKLRLLGGVTALSLQPGRPEFRPTKVPNFNVRPELAEAKSSQLCRRLGNAQSEGKSSQL
jgi:hypothetical protein